MAAPSDAEEVLSAFRLGWALAEVRGRNRPDGPPGGVIWMPDHVDHALPLRLERSRTELRIEAQAVVLALSKDLKVDKTSKVKSFGKALDDQAKSLSDAGAPRAAAALERGRRQLEQATADHSQVGDPTPTLEQVACIWEVAVASERTRVGRAGDADDQRTVPAMGPGVPAHPERRAKAPPVEASPKRQPAKDLIPGRQIGLRVLQDAYSGLCQAIAADPQTAARRGIALTDAGLQAIVATTQPAWENLAELIWRFDAHIQDQLTATSETQANAYQLGRALAETYWALDTAQDDGSSGWHFLLGDERCSEMERLVGRLGAYMGEFTAPAIVGSVEIWNEVAKTAAWHADRQLAASALYSQIRRWYELIILGQDPTTLISPYRLLKGYRTVGRALKLFWPQLVATLVGLGFLVALLVLLTIGGGATWFKTLSGVLAAVGVSLAGITGSVKNSAQAALKRLRQDAYTELVALAVLTAPPAPKGMQPLKIINGRKLTVPTPQ
jgi:hypothetical protein